MVVEKGSIPASTKTEPGHGYGLGTIFQTAEELDGHAICYTLNQEFILDVYIKNETSG